MSYRVGDIVHVANPFGRDDNKDKFMIIVSLDPAQFLAVNTSDHGNYDAIPLLKKGREFPRYDSFIGCKTLLMPNLNQITNKVGELDKDELAGLKAKFEVSLHLTGYQIERLCENLNEAINRP